MVRTFTAVIHKEGDLFVAECPEVGTVSQGPTIEGAIANLREATELYLEEFPVRGGAASISDDVRDFRRWLGCKAIRLDASARTIARRP